MTLIDHLGSAGTGADRPTLTVPLAGEFDNTREVEMSRVTVVDAGGLRGMLAARAYLEGRGCELQLLHPSRQLRHVLDVAGLEAVLTIVEERR